LKNASSIEVGTTASVANLPAGTYTLTVSDDCSSKSNRLLNLQPAALATSTKSDALVLELAQVL
jgi:hypothetical protein